MSQPHHLGKSEFVTLMALMTSLVALAIDAMLPAFPQIASHYSVTSAEQTQLIIAVLFFGFGFGQLIFGPVSDFIGRKPPIYWGLGIFMIGAVLSGFANSYEVFLLGRFLQGFGGAAPRVISLALVRDEYSGRDMAQITSLVMTVFILVPAVAPSLGQAVLIFSSWRAIFILLFLVSCLVWVWFGLRQHETLPKEKRRSFALQDIVFGVKETFTQPTTLACMLVSGLVFGIFVGYLGAVQEIFDKIFGAAETFPVYFGVLALSIGTASFFNSRLVTALGMRKLILIAFLSMAIISNLFAVYLTAYQEGHPPLWLFMSYMMVTFFAVGFLFGNLNALAMQPLGHVAGIGSALLGFTQSTLSVVIGVVLGHYFHDGVAPLAMSFGTVSIVSIGILMFERRFQKSVAN